MTGLLLPSRHRRSSHGQLIASVDPDLDADHSESRMRLRKPVVDIRPEGMKRKTALKVPFRARNLSSVEPAGYSHLDALRSEALGIFHCAPHSPPEGDSLFELLGDLFCLQLGIQLRL